jgi:hypothetical protein
MPKFKDIAIFQIPITPDQNYKQEVIDEHYHQIPMLPRCKTVTNEVNLLT